MLHGHVPCDIFRIVAQKGQFMSNGGTPVTPPQPQVLVTRPSWEERITKFVMGILLIGGMIYVSRLKSDDKISTDDADKITQSILKYAPLVMAKPPEKPESTVVVGPQQPVGIGPLELIQLVPVIKQALKDVIGELRDVIPKPDPKPLPDPVPIDPKPVPIDPITTGPKIVVTNELGKPIVAATVESGVLFQVSSNVAPANAAWSVSRTGDVRLVTLPGNAGFVCYLSGSSWVEVHLTDFGTRQQAALRITCNQGPQPPPKPIVIVDPKPPIDVTPKPDPKPDPKPVVTDQKLGIYFVYDPSNVTPETSKMLKSSLDWLMIESRGHDYRSYQPTTMDDVGKWAIKQISDKGMHLPAIVFVDSNRFLLDIIPAPDSMQDVNDAIKRFGGK